MAADTTTTDPALASARELAARIARRELSSRELLEHFVRRIERLNPPLNAVVTLDLERARARADAADAALARGESWGPLHGLPITVKDSFETAGLRTTCGAPHHAEHVPERDAIAVQRLVDAGCVVFGKTNTPFLAGDVQTYNPVHGVTRNAWDPERTPGGSSGGAVTAVACGLTAFELGSDLGGSIRTPCGWSGVYGLKTSHGVVPLRGHVPGPPGTLAESDLGVVGPIARDADDLELLLDVLAGPLPERAIAWRLELPPARRTRLRDYRVAAWLDDPAYPVDAQVLERLSGTVDALRAAGVAVDDTARPAFALADAMRTYQRLLYAILAAGFPDEAFRRFVELAPSLPQDAPDSFSRFVLFGTARHRDWLAANELRERFRRELARFFERYDVLLCPIVPVPAIAHDHSEPMTDRRITVNGESRPYFDLFAWISVASLTYAPAVAAPIGATPDGLPIGVQIVGPYLEDRTPIDFARRLADVVGGFVPPPRAVS
ncbi:MAG TPA: amidase [Candidatus Binatia bacterium]